MIFDCCATTAPNLRLNTNGGNDGETDGDPVHYVRRLETHLAAERQEHADQLLHVRSAVRELFPIERLPIVVSTRV